jgi:hypothetical protein
MVESESVSIHYRPVFWPSYSLIISSITCTLLAHEPLLPVKDVSFLPTKAIGRLTVSAPGKISVSVYRTRTLDP